MNMISKKSEYTFIFNKNKLRYDWLRLTPAYSVKLVEDILNEQTIQPNVVLDPFSGTATTPLTCAYRGINAIAVEINPFLHWMGNLKMKQYPETTADALVDEGNRIVESVSRCNTSVPNPNIFKIERWWRKDQLEYLCRLKYQIDICNNPDLRDLLNVAFCKTIIELSGAAFNHVSTSFKPNTAFFDYDVGSKTFITALTSIANTLNPNPIGSSQVILGDSRSIPNGIGDVDLVITSPPYPNRISYIRELRPYMYWLGYLKESSEAGELDWSAIGGTWGSATSKLNDWQFQYLDVKGLKECCDAITKADKKGELMAKYVNKYFVDMQKHLKSVFNAMRLGSSAHYIIGNSTFYDVVVPSDLLYESMMINAGFKDVYSEIVRKRNSKKELFEYRVVGKKY